MSVVVSASSPPPAVSAAGEYLARLERRTVRVGSYLCLGVDPDPALLPKGFTPDVNGIEAFSRLLIEAASPHAAAIKANVAFFEAFGSAGIAALERIRASVPADIPFVADAKRGDIDSTVARQAVALFDALGADAITANPYLGRQAIAPFLDRMDKFVYVLCRTSNPGAAEFQNLPIDGVPLYVHVATRVAAWSETGDHVGLVVGATAPTELAEIRAAAPALPILIPGLGAQGGDIDAVRLHGPATDGPASGATGGGLIVSVSRGIASAAVDADDPGAAIAAAAESWASRLRV
jgi:orotidine-5'-phosphate decarboxylase